MSEKELRQKLLEKGYDAATAAYCTDWLAERRYLNDAEYARMLVRHYSSKGYGSGRIRSEFLRRGIAGIGLGAAFLMYFLNLIANITDSVKFLKYITPFGYCDGAEVVSNGRLDGAMLAVGAGLALLGILAAFRQYERKDIR